MFEVCCVLGLVVVVSVVWGLLCGAEAKRLEKVGADLATRVAESEKALEKARRVEAVLSRRGPFGG